MCALTTNNASNNNIMTENLKKLLKDSRSGFTNNYLTPCMSHILNLAVQHGLKELGNEEIYLDSKDDEEYL